MFVEVGASLVSQLRKHVEGKICGDPMRASIKDRRFQISSWCGISVFGHPQALGKYQHNNSPY